MIEIPFNKKHDMVLRIVIEVIRQHMISEIEDGREGPEILEHEHIYQLIQQNRILIRLRNGNPPVPEFSVIPTLEI